MRPLGTRCWRKNHRKASRGIPTGRRTTRKVETTYGRHQKAQALADDLASKYLTAEVPQ